MAFMFPSLRGGLKRSFEQTRSTILSCISRGYPAASVNEGEYAPTDSELVGIVRERDGLAILHNPIENKVRLMTLLWIAVCSHASTRYM